VHEIAVIAGQVAFALFNAEGQTGSEHIMHWLHAVTPEHLSTTGWTLHCCKPVLRTLPAVHETKRLFSGWKTGVSNLHYYRSDRFILCLGAISFRDARSD
jgi:hypothetical protein